MAEMEPNDQDWFSIMEDLVRGDSRQQRAAVFELRRLICRCLGTFWQFKNRPDDLDDVCQETVVKLVKSYCDGKIRDRQRFPGFVATTATRTAIDHLGKWELGKLLFLVEDLEALNPDESPELAPSWLSPEEASELGERKASVREAVHQLQEPLRTVAELRFLKQLTQEQAAAATDIPLGSLKTYTWQAEVELYLRLGGIDELPDDRRKLIDALYLQRLSLRETASLLGVTVDVLRALRNETLRQIRDTLKERRKKTRSRK